MPRGKTKGTMVPPSFGRELPLPPLYEDPGSFYLPDYLLYTMDPVTMDKVDAIISVHEKATEVRAACLVYDHAMLELRKQYFLNPDPVLWPQELASRLELLSQERRKKRRTKLRSVQTALQKLLTMPTCEPDKDGDGSRPESLDLPLEPRPRQTTGDTMQGNSSSMTCILHARVMAAFECCVRMQALIQEFDELYNARVRSRTFSPEDRVSLRRARPRMQKGTHRAIELRDIIKDITDEWWPYIEILMSEAELEALFKTMRDMKVSHRAFLEKAIPVCSELAKLYGNRDTIVNEVIKLSFQHEAEWLALGDRPLFGYKYRHEMKKYDDLLARANAQRGSHDSALLAVKQIDDWASSPAVVPTARGTDIHIDRLFQAEEKVRELHRVLNTMAELVEPLLASLEKHVTTLSLPCVVDENILGQSVDV